MKRLLISLLVAMAASTAVALTTPAPRILADGTCIGVPYPLHANPKELCVQPPGGGGQ